MPLHYVISGTSRGIGLEMTRQLLANGHSVTALARNPAASQGLAELRKKYPATLKSASVDVTSEEQVRGFARELGSAPVDVLINNAGVYGSSADLEQLPLDEVLQTFNTNAVAPMRLTRALLPALRRSAAPKVIHITSLMGSIGDNGSGGSYGYRMSKAALNMFEKCFSIEFPEITSAVIHPGWVKTDMGGPNAPTPPEESARGILRVIEKLRPADSGKFLDYEGDILPW